MKALEDKCRRCIPRGSKGPISKLAAGLLPHQQREGQGEVWPNGEENPKVTKWEPPEVQSWPRQVRKEKGWRRKAITESLTARGETGTSVSSQPAQTPSRGGNVQQSDSQQSTAAPTGGPVGVAVQYPQAAFSPSSAAVSSSGSGSVGDSTGGGRSLGARPRYSNKRARFRIPP